MSTAKLTKSEVISQIAESTELDRKAVTRVLDTLRDIATKELRHGAEFIVPGILKLRSVAKPATQDRPGINPFTKQPMTIRGKPASKKLRATPLKVFRDAVQ